MAKGNTIVGLDVGSGSVRTVIAQDFSSDDPARVVGVGSFFRRN